jgi:hypothetical protein
VVLSIGRILAETAPLYLTSGLSASSSIALNSPGQTLTTRIYAQIFTANISEGLNVMYECAFVTIILVLLIILFVHVVIPNYYKWQRNKTKNAYLSTIIQNTLIHRNAILASLTIPSNQLSNDQKRILGIPLDKKIKVKSYRKKQRKK